MGKEILGKAAKENRPEMNVLNSRLTCQTCREEVREGHYSKGVLIYWCSEDHQSKLEIEL